MIRHEFYDKDRNFVDPEFGYDFKTLVISNIGGFEFAGLDVLLVFFLQLFTRGAAFGSDNPPLCDVAFAE